MPASVNIISALIIFYFGITMRENIILISRELAAFIISGLVLVFCMAMVYIDVNWMNDALHETSFTEATQELMLAAIAALFFLAA